MHPFVVLYFPDHRGPWILVDLIDFKGPSITHKKEKRWERRMGENVGFHGMTYDTDDNIQGKKKIEQGGGREGEEGMGGRERGRVT